MRADLRLDDLRERKRVPAKLMNVKIPTLVGERIRQVASALGASKTEVVIALLNEGLAASEKLLAGYEPPAGVSRAARRRARRGRPRAGRTCSVDGCTRAHLARGYCATHYQAWRRGALKT
ncbi:MAG: hypothetical protein KatS3mg076_1602 [Candidatus Binatia bacterium]|nr:MAG: hypothetical protein KatS3mg076_1602 [Candidatus Binatia bacterium]